MTRTRTDLHFHAGLNTRETPEELAEDLKRHIKFRFDTLKRFAAETGISESNLQNVLSGKKYIPERWSGAFADKLGMHEKYLLTGEHPVYKDRKASLNFGEWNKPIRLTHAFERYAELTASEWGLVHRLLEVAHLQGELPDELVHADFEKLDGHVNVEQIPDLALSILGKYFKTHLASVCREDVAYCMDDSDPEKDEETASADSIEDINRDWLARPQDKFEFRHLFEYLMLSVNRDERGRIVTGYIEVSLCPHFLLVPDGHPARKNKDYE